MPQSRHLMFVPPDEPNLAKLHIEEAPAASGPWAEIEAVTTIGAYPDYISEYTTNLAVNAQDWFRIWWEDDKGAATSYSQAWRGGTTTLVGSLVKRVRERDSTIDVRVAQQEAEGAIQTYLGDTVDPYDPTLTLSYREMNGLTYMVLARALVVHKIISSASGSVSSVTLGLVKMQSGGSSGSTAQVSVDVQKLIDMANELLGKSYSVVMLLEEVAIGNSVTAWNVDQSRLVLETEIM